MHTILNYDSLFIKIIFLRGTYLFLNLIAFIYSKCTNHVSPTEQSSSVVQRAPTISSNKKKNVFQR